MLLIMSKRRRWPRGPAGRTGWGYSGTIIGGAVAAAVTVPAHGFVVNSARMGLMGAGAEMAPAPVVAWIKTFLGACGWAFMIAAGSLVYSHFVGKWQAHGYPILPVAALAATDNMQPRNTAIPLSGGPYGAQAQAATQSSTRRESAPRQTSFLDEYEG